MSGTEIAALRLALGCLRHYTHPDEAADAIRDALAALALPTWAGHRPLYATLTTVESRLGYDHSARLVRARLALHLRAVLRAERDDCGPSAMICTRCDRERGHAHCACCAPSGTCTCWGAWRSGYHRITPLWQAPGVRGAR